MCFVITKYKSILGETSIFSIRKFKTSSFGKSADCTIYVKIPWQKVGETDGFPATVDGNCLNPSKINCKDDNKVNFQKNPDTRH